MKKITIGIDKFQAEWIFSPIRTRRDALMVLMKTVKILLLNNSPSADQTVGKIVLLVTKMSRIFFESENKVYSISFPFNVVEVDGMLNFRTHHHSGITHKVSSDVLSLLESSDIFESSEVFSFAEPIDDMGQIDPEIWALFRELLLTEEGYIRYDYDMEHVNGHYHPVNHFDLFFSSSATFKLGLHEPTDVEGLIDMLEVTSECRYVTKATAEKQR